MTATGKVLVVLGHPRRPSLCAALAEAYVEGARAAGMKVRAVDLGAIEFDPDLHTVSPLEQPLEPELERARELMHWADHVTVVFPGWWGVGPARLKGFLDRVLLPGDAFQEKDDGGFEGLLRGRTAHLVTTLDMPPWVYRVVFRAGGHQALKRSALGFCGIATTRTLTLGPVKDSDAALRRRWLARAHELGYSLRDGPRSRVGRGAAWLKRWLQALRLQFYPMTWMAYTVGALGGATVTGSWNARLYGLGYACLFFLEAATVFSNERFDHASDRRNRNAGPFNGGSRVLVDGLLSARQMERATLAALAAALACAGVLLLSADAGTALVLALLALLVLALGYTVPPLRLSWRGMGELDVALTHSIGVILPGYLIQGGFWRDPFPWLVSLPLLLAVLPSIALSGIPDLEADREAGKRTLAVRLGVPRAIVLVIAATCAAPLAVLFLQGLPVLHDAFRGVLLLAVPHAVLLVALLYRYRRRPAAGRIDGLMVASLSFILWFVLIPLLALW